MRPWYLALSILLGALTAPRPRADAQQPLASVTVKVAGFKGTEGLALVALYDSEASWLKIPKAAQLVRAKITGAALTVELKDVKPGTYAIAIIHDANKNNALDMRWLPYPRPKEGVGVSNDPEKQPGPPRWDGAKFAVGAAPVTVKATLRYPD